MSGPRSLSPTPDRDDPGDQGVDRLRLLARGSAVAGALIGVLVLGGWALDVQVLKNIGSGWAEMKANAALAFVFAGTALWFSTSVTPRDARRTGHVVRLLAGAVVAIGLATLVEHVGDVDLAIDQILFADRRLTGARGVPGRMAPQSAAAFALLGWVLLRRQGRAVGARQVFNAVLVLPVVCIGALGLANYLYAMPAGQGIPGFSALSIHTSVGLLVLASGTLAAGGPSGVLGVVVGPGAGGRIARRILPWVIVAPIALGLLQLEGQRAGLYSVEQGLALFAVTNVMVFALLAWWSARTVGLADVERLRSVSEREILEEGHRRVFERSPVALYRTTPDGEILDANAALLRMLGYPNRAALVGGRARTHYTDPTARDRFRTLLEAGSLVEGFVAELRRHDGSTFWAEDTCAVVRGPDGTVTHYEGCLVDITERHLAEEHQAASERRFRALIEQSADGIVLLARDGTPLYQSPASERIFGRPPSDLIGHPFHEKVHPEDLHRFVAVLRTVMATPGAASEFESRVLHADGGWRWIEGVVTNLLEDQHVRALVGNYRDVTARKEAQEALRESDARFRQMADHVKEAFFVLDVHRSLVLYVSPTWSEIWGRPLEEGYDLKVWEDTAHADDRAALKASLEAAKLGRAHDDTFLIARPDGATAWVRRRTFPVRDIAGLVYRLVGVSEDITALRLAEERFIQAQKLEAVGRLAGGVAHDFNNLLAVILGWTGMALVDLPADHPVRESLEEVMKAGEGATSLTKQLLAFSRKQVMQPTQFNPNDLVVATDKMLRRLIGEDISFVTRTDPTLGTVSMDRGQLEQVLMNLVVNARDAMPRGGKITVETRTVVLDDDAPDAAPDRKPGEYAVLSVADTGTGMSEAVRARIFEPFFTTKESGKGTGLGLATCYGIVKQAGGHIEVESESGAGTVFRVYIPSIQAPAEATATPVATVEGGSETILLVEDEDAVRRVAARMLASLDYRVLEARNAEDALGLLRDRGEHPDLLLTDVVLPGMGGRELAEEALRLHPRLKVLYSSGYTDDVILQHQVIARDVGVLQKPYSREQLSRKLREVLDRA